MTTEEVIGSDSMPVLGVSDFVALMNQVLDMAFPSVVIAGELANFKVSKNRWVYFDLKDETASVRFFGTVYVLPGPLEDGMLVEVRGAPRLHNQFGFSVTVESIRPVGEGAIHKAAELLQAKLTAEGLFEPERKRLLPYPPTRIGLITSRESAAYADFIKIVNARWRGLEVELADVHVQGEQAPEQIVAAIRWFNERGRGEWYTDGREADGDGWDVDVLVLIRGGGSADDLAAFSVEQVVRAVAASRVPTLVAIGHEIDVSLAELAADQRASTPSNAAELLVPDRRDSMERLRQERDRLHTELAARLDNLRVELQAAVDEAGQYITHLLEDQRVMLENKRSLAKALSPQLALQRGFAIVRRDGKAVRSGLREGDIVDITLSAATAQARVESVVESRSTSP